MGSFDDKPKKHVACMLCRKRKLKCGGDRPECGYCKRNGFTCQYNEVHRKSGPKKGYVRVLESRVAELEDLLKERSRSPVPEQGQMARRLSKASESPNNRNSAFNNLKLSEPVASDPASTGSTNSITDEEAHNELHRIVTGLSEQDVDMLVTLYFDTAHQGCMFINRLNFLRRMKSTADRPSLSLQYAVLLAATQNSVPHLHLCEFLYQQTRKHCEKEEMNATFSKNIDYCQATLLTAAYESRTGWFAKSFLSVARAVGCVEILKLPNMDMDKDNKEIVIMSDSIRRDEERRTFYMTVYYSCLCSSSSGWPGFLRFCDIFVKLPIDDEAFNSGQPSLCVSYDALVARPRVLVDIIENGNREFGPEILEPGDIYQEYFLEPLKDPARVIFALYMVVAASLNRNSDLMRFPKKDFNDQSVGGDWMGWYKRAKVSGYAGMSLFPPAMQIVNDHRYSKVQVGVLISLRVHFNAAILDLTRAGLVGLQNQPSLKDRGFETRQSLIARCGIAATRMISSVRYVTDFHDVSLDSFTIFSMYCCLKYCAAVISTGNPGSDRLAPQMKFLFQVMDEVGDTVMSAKIFRVRGMSFIPEALHSQFVTPGLIKAKKEIESGLIVAPGSCAENDGPHTPISQSMKTCSDADKGSLQADLIPESIAIEPEADEEMPIEATASVLHDIRTIPFLEEASHEIAEPLCFPFEAQDTPRWDDVIEGLENLPDFDFDFSEQQISNGSIY